MADRRPLKLLFQQQGYRFLVSLIFVTTEGRSCRVSFSGLHYYQTGWIGYLARVRV